MSKLPDIGFFEINPKKSKEGGKNILLLHGWGASKERLRALGDKLARRGWHVVSLDLPGFGQTPATVKPLNLADYAKFVDEFSKKVFGRSYFVVFGHSFGGRVAIKLSLSCMKVKGLVLCATSGLTRTNIFKRIIFSILAKMGRILLITPNTAYFFRRILYKLAREHDYEMTNVVGRMTMRRVISEEIKPLLPRLSVPTLILWGEKDKMTSVKGTYLAKKLINRSIVKIFPGVGHTLPYVKPAAISQEITIWSKTFMH